MEDSGIDSDSKNKTHMDDASDSSSSSSTNKRTFPRSHSRILQKKLEARLEQVKRIQSTSQYSKVPDAEPEVCYSNCSSSYTPKTLLPFDQVSVPSKKISTLIEFIHSSDSEDETTIFPMKRETKQDITDTFSIEELSDGSEDSLHLGTAPETPQIRAPPKYFCCQCLII